MIKPLHLFCAAALLAVSCAGGGDGKTDDEDGGPFGTDTDTDVDTDSDTDTDTGDPDCYGELEWNGCETTVTCTGDEYRVYSFQTDCPLLEGVPPSGQLVVEELEGQVVARTSDVMFDALFALAMQEVRDASVESIQDWSFDDNSPVDCSCFETGEKWHYVWTRDTAYAAHLGLAAVEPSRTARSLSFKLSGRKASAGGGQVEIVQDTGSGGSWPVSTDRVVWALGAWEALKFLDGDERQEFFDAAYEALVNTVERDRVDVHDPRDGLYRGEQSFLDWREQTYPTWTAQTTVHQGMSKSLSTNAGHHAALVVASLMAEEAGDTAAAERYSGWAEDLAQAVNDGLWLEERGLYSTLKATELDDAPLEKFDLLGESLAILGGIADGARAETVASSYPHTAAGSPVIWPQNPMTPIYHNRGIWPFVTAYGIRAAAAAGNAPVVERGVRTLMNGAATNLSNMENFEFMTLSNHVEDGDLSGPVINSRRQLWSVAGYLSMVIDTLFGIHAEQGGLRFEPFAPCGLYQDLFEGAPQIELRDFPYKGGKIDVILDLGGLGSETEGYWGAVSVELNGAEVAGGLVVPGDLGEGDEIRVELGGHQGSSGGATVVEDEGDFTVFYAPKEPSLAAPSLSGDDLLLSWDANGETDVVFNVFRNGVRVAAGVDGTAWTDTEWSAAATWTPCYSVEAEYPIAGTTSHHSAPQCYWGESYERIFQFDADAITGPATVFEHGRLHFADWGYSDQTLVVDSFTAAVGGDYHVQIDFGNGRPVDTGITCGVKRVEVRDNSDDSLAGAGIAMMPHLGAGDWDRWDYSSFVPVTLEGGASYRIEVSDEPNMSYFDHFAIYTGGDGGGADVLNRVNVSGVKLLLMEAL